MQHRCPRPCGARGKLVVVLQGGMLGHFAGGAHLLKQRVCGDLERDVRRSRRHRGDSKVLQSVVQGVHGRRALHARRLHSAANCRALSQVFGLRTIFARLRRRAQTPLSPVRVPAGLGAPSLVSHATQPKSSPWALATARGNVSVCGHETAALAGVGLCHTIRVCVPRGGGDHQGKGRSGKRAGLPTPLIATTIQASIRAVQLVRRMRRQSHSVASHRRLGTQAGLPSATSGGGCATTSLLYRCCSLPACGDAAARASANPCGRRREVHGPKYASAEQCHRSHRSCNDEWQRLRLIGLGFVVAIGRAADCASRRAW